MNGFRFQKELVILIAAAVVGGMNLLGRSSADDVQQEPSGVTSPEDRLEELQGVFEVVQTDVAGTQPIVPAEVLGLTMGDEVTINGNELKSGEEVLATLTTDFSDTGLNLDAAVHVTRRPVLLTLPNGKGLLCAYESHPGHEFVLVHPHTMRGITTGTWLTLAHSEE
jgi:hypothetical protein